MGRGKNNLKKKISACHNRGCNNAMCEQVTIEDKTDDPIPVEKTKIPKDDNNKILTDNYPFRPQLGIDTVSVGTSEIETGIYENSSVDNEVDAERSSANSYMLPPLLYKPNIVPIGNSADVAKINKNEFINKINDQMLRDCCDRVTIAPIEQTPVKETEACSKATTEGEISYKKQQVDHPVPYIRYNANENEDNALERCKKNCANGIFDLTELLEVCRKDPDSILRAYREYHTQDQDLPKFSGKCFMCMENEESDCASIKHTHGEKFGDPKYHYLMVGASTSITFPEMEVKPQHGIMRNREETIEVQSAPVVSPEVDDKHHEILAPQPSEPPQSTDDKSETSSITIIQTTLKIDGKRPSNVSWSRLLDTDNIPRHSTTDSIEKIELKATAKADKFRHNVNAKKYYSLLGDIVREEKYKTQDSRKSSEGKSLECPEMHASKNKYFGFMKGKNKRDSMNKSISEEQVVEDLGDEEMVGAGSEECSETESRKRSGSSTESYRRRSSPIEHPVFEAHDEISKYLNNVTPHRMSR